MQAQDRVRFDDATYGLELGTVLRVSLVGYVVVRWDSDGSEGVFTPSMAADRLTVVTGDAALHRHDWLELDICRRCLVRWSSERMDEPCYQIHPDGVR